METITQKYKIRFSSTVSMEIDPLCQDIESALSSGSDDKSLTECGLAEFVLAEHRPVVRRKNGSTLEVELSIEGVHAFAREVAYRIGEARDRRAEEERGSYQYITSIIRTCETALKNANKVLEGAGFKPVHSYWSSDEGVLVPA